MDRKNTYTVESITELADSNPEKRMIIEYRLPIGDRQKGELLTAGYSLSGVPVLQIGSFANWVYPGDVTGHYFID